MKFFLLAVLLALVASARADVTVFEVEGEGPVKAYDDGLGAAGFFGPIAVTSDKYCTPGDPSSGIPVGATVTVTLINGYWFGPLFTYGKSCEFEGANCPGWTSGPPAYPQSHFLPSLLLHYSYTLNFPGGYLVKFYGNKGADLILPPRELASLEIVTSTCGGCPPGTVCSDPIITGFDGSAFHFDEVGEYVLLESGDGYKVHSTFAGATATNSDLEMMERSWTSSVRLFSPNGDMVSCALPAIVPNTTRLQVTAASASGVTMLSMDNQSIELPEMSASVLLSEGEGPKYVAGCILSTPKMDIRVDQLSGYEQAMKFPDTEAWAAPFTWLNSGFTVKKPLASPVTGILGATYPADKVAEQYALSAGSEGTKTSARMDGEGPGPKTHRRALAAQSTPFLPVSSGIVGLSH